MHLPPRGPPAPCTTGKCIFRDTVTPHPSHILLGTRHAIDFGGNWGLLFFCNVRRRMHRSTDRSQWVPDTRVRCVARHAGDCRGRAPRYSPRINSGRGAGRGGAARELPAAPATARPQPTARSPRPPTRCSRCSNSSAGAAYASHSTTSVYFVISKISYFK